MVVPADSVLRGPPARAGRYTLHAEIASGGMATVYLGQMLGAHGFSRVVAIKRMLPRLARDPRFHAMFVDEARLASRVQHPNVVPILDVVDEDGEVMIVMEYVRGPSLSALLETLRRNDARIPVSIAAAIGCGMLAGLHAAHEARDRRGNSLGIVHRDVSPQNVLVGIDGVTRIMDFGVAKATELAPADDGTLTGKIAYMAPEQFEGSGVDRRTDVFAAGVVLWGALAGRRLFRAGTVVEAMSAVCRGEIPPLAEYRDDVPPELEQVMKRALRPDRESRPETAEAFAAAIEAATSLASSRAVADWVGKLAGSMVSERDAVIVQIEKTRTAMAISSPGVTDEADPVRSDVITNEWVRDPGSRPEPSAAVTQPKRDGVPEPPRASRATPILVGVAVALAVALLGVSALWLTRDPRPTRAAAASAASEPIPAQPARSSAPAETASKPVPDAAASASASASPQAARPRTAPKPKPASPPPKPTAGRGREDYLPPSPFGN